MEYTNDLILNVHYDEVTNTISFKNKTRGLLDAIKKHKIITASVTILLAFIAIDSVLLVNFMHILETI